MSREKRPFVVYGFESTHDALGAESLLGDMGIDVVPIPTPASIGALCGIALRVPPEQSERAERYLENVGIRVSAKVNMEDF
ncbi:MAG TPA: DUF3343 domain-containing protein [Coriobacteriia bacterium]|nr:DUF3343 domain-containing protein [Coriobacteriia bacterium]